jgi:signal recognition particle subunit SRP54
MPDLTDEQSELMEKELKRTEAIIDSMTRAERMNHMILNANRRRRIARGSGTTVQQVNSLIKQYTEMRRMMQQLSSSGMFGGGGLGGKMMRRMTGIPNMDFGGGDPGTGGLPAGLPVHRGRRKRRRRNEDETVNCLEATLVRPSLATSGPSKRKVLKESQFC